MKKTKGADRMLTEKVFVDTIRELRETFATKKDLEAFATKNELKTTLSDVEEKIDEKNREYRDQILTKIDSFAKRVVDLEDDNAIGADQTRELRLQVDDHDLPASA